LPGFYERRTDSAAPNATEHIYRLFVGSREVAQVQRMEQGGSIVTDKTFFLHGDALGSTNVIADSSGHSVHVQRYNPFGKSEELDTATGVTAGFTGHEDESSLGLVNMGGRLYDPIIGRFTTADPFVQASFWSQGLNRYSYTWNNFMNWTDPSGFENDGGAPSGASDGGEGPADASETDN